MGIHFLKISTSYVEVMEQKRFFFGEFEEWALHVWLKINLRNYFFVDAGSFPRLAKKCMVKN